MPIERVTENSKFAVVAMAASAGGLKALSHVLAAMPSDFPVPILVVQHLEPRRRSRLAEVLSLKTKLHVKVAEQGEAIRGHTVYVAPQDHHLLVDHNGTISLSQSPQVNFTRPSADVLFESVAKAYGDRAIAIVLTGEGHDGAAGSEAVCKSGGTVIAQDQQSSQSFGMPGGAIAKGSVRWVLPLDEIAPALQSLVASGEWR